MLGAIVAATLAGALLYRFVETPMTRFLHRRARRSPASAVHDLAKGELPLEARSPAAGHVSLTAEDAA